MFGKMFVLIAALTILNAVESANILIVAPFPALSHYQMLEPIITTLIERKHNVTVVSCYSLPGKFKNYTHVNVKNIYPEMELDFTPWNLIPDLVDLFKFGREHCVLFASSSEIQNFLKSDNEFDLIIIEAFDTDCYLGFVAKYRTPYVTFSPMPLTVWQNDWIYNPTEPSHVPDHICRLHPNMDFYDRFKNFICHAMLRWFNSRHNTKPTLKIIEKYFNVTLGGDYDMEKLKKNTSLMLVNSYHAVTGNRPFFPNVLEIGGIHIKQGKKLPEKIEKFLNESLNGVIVISMGSIVKAHKADDRIKKSFIDAISKLEQRVIWKWEDENFLGKKKPDNVMTLPWFPQFDILCHPNVKIFVSHGGIHGIYESVHAGVPIVGIPLFGDQMSNLKILENKGVAVTIQFSHLNEITITEAIEKILKNKSYATNSKKLSNIFKDRPQNPLEKSIFWIEHVIRYKGGKHLQTGAFQLTWMQSCLFDILFSSAFLFIFILYCFIKFFNFFSRFFFWKKNKIK